MHSILFSSDHLRCPSETFRLRRNCNLNFFRYISQP
nr:MAG TPA: hypothetical protein [Caudoviricetes sp.]